jgi:glc operon protein GlcG
VLATILVTAVFVTSSSAQTNVARAATLASVTVSAEDAKKTLVKTQINAATAKAIAEACVDFARASNASYSIFVLAPSTDIVHAHIMDGQFPIAIEAALLKAKTVLYARTSSRSVAERFPTVDTRLFRTDLGETSGRAYYFAPGGLPIVVEDQLIGAIGVGGGPQEEQCAYQALTKVLGPQPPLPPVRQTAATPPR